MLYRCILGLSSRWVQCGPGKQLQGGYIPQRLPCYPLHLAVDFRKSNYAFDKLGFPLLQPPIPIAKLGVAMAEFGVFLDVSN